MDEFIFSIKTKRVWWKPWTWRRRELIDAYWPLTESVDNTAEEDDLDDDLPGWAVVMKWQVKHEMDRKQRELDERKSGII